MAKKDKETITPEMADCTTVQGRKGHLPTGIHILNYNQNKEKAMKIFFEAARPLQRGVGGAPWLIT